MKSIFKRSAIGLAIFGLAGSSLAMHQGCQNNNWSPQITGVFLGVEGLYLRPQTGDLDYATDANLGTSGASLSNRSISTDYDWGWRVYGGIKITDNDDVTVSWLHFDHSYSDAVHGATTVITRFGASGTPVDGWPNASVNFKLDEAYGVWGHTMHHGNNPWSVRIAAGVEYAELKSNLSAVLLDTSGDVSDFSGNSKFNGWGPRFELDAEYGLWGFDWFIRTNAVLLSSYRQVDMDSSLTTTGEPTLTFTGDWDKRHVVIPKLGMKVGVGYSYLFGQAGAEGVCGTTLTAEIGWQSDVYIHAIERASSIELIAAGAGTKVSNFSDQGMFIGLKVSSDWI